MTVSSTIPSSPLRAQCDKTLLPGAAVILMVSGEGQDLLEAPRDYGHEPGIKVRARITRPARNNQEVQRGAQAPPRSGTTTSAWFHCRTSSIDMGHDT